MPDDRISAWRGVLLAQNRVVRAIEEDLTRAGTVPLSSYDVLLELAAAPGRSLRMQDLGERVVLSRSRVSRLIDELERDGLVVRRPDQADGRAILACMTPEGLAAYRTAMPVYLAGIERHFTSLLTDAERRAVARGLGKVVDHHHRL